MMLKMKLLTAIIKNRNSFRMNRELIGYSKSRVLRSFRRADIIRYAEAIKDDNPSYRIEDPFLPPFYMSRLAYTSFIEGMTQPGLGMNFLRSVHASQSMTWTRQIQAHEKCMIRGVIRSISDTPAGELIEIAGEVLCGDEVISESKTGFIIRARHSIPKENSEPVKQPDQVPVFSLDIQTDEGQQMKYAKASGDSNFIHTSNLLARRVGLKRTIIQGVCILSMACTALTEELLDGDNTRLSGISCRFASPAYPGERLKLVACRSDVPGQVPFNVYDPAGNIVLKKGLFTFRVENHPVKG